VPSTASSSSFRRRPCRRPGCTRRALSVVPACCEHATSAYWLAVGNLRPRSGLLRTLGGVVTRRFVDDGRWLGAFAGEFDVVCLRCRGAAKVRREWDRTRRAWCPATVLCTSCGFSRRQQASPGKNSSRGQGFLPDSWAGPVAIFGKRRCGNCGRRMIGSCPLILDT
jgi:hypothetical protein